MIAFHSLLLFVGLILITWAADKFITGAAGLAKLLGLSTLFIGLTVVAIGTATPEIFIAISSSLVGKNELAIGNVLGSNIANIGLVLGICALIKPLQVHSKVLVREYPILLALLLLSWLLLYDHNLSRFDGFILLLGFFLLLSWIIWISIKSPKKEAIVKEFEKELPRKISLSLTLFYLAIGIILLPISSALIVRHAIAIAKIFHIDEVIIGLTIIAIGSSLPELAAAIAGTIKKEYDLVIGNIIGSNIFNILLVLPFPGLINPGNFQKIILQRDLIMMCFITILLFGALKGFKNKQIIFRWEGAIFLSSYIGYLIYLGITTFK